MYSSSSSSSSQSERSMGPTGLLRYGSAPSTLLTTAVDSVINNNNNNNNNSSSGAGSSVHHHHNHHQEFSIFGSSPLQTATFNMAAPLPHPPPPQQQHRYFTGADWSPLSPDSNCKVNAHNNPNSANLSPDPKRPDKGLQRSSGFLNNNNNHHHNNSNDLHSANLKIGAGGSSSSTSNLVRHSSSPAGFLSHLMPDTGFSAMRGSGGYSRGGSNGGAHGTSGLKPQLSFTRQDSGLSHISEVNENVIEGLHSSNGHRDSQHTFAYGTDSWDTNSHSITFSSPSNKRAKNNGEGLFLNCLENQYSMPHAEMDKLLIPGDSVTWKIRAKRGCATHPRSIAERERRTRISAKLKKLQDLVPNMDKQTSYADMLDLAVQHIKGLQEQVEKLNKSQERCTCGCKLSKT